MVLGQLITMIGAFLDRQWTIYETGLKSSSFHNFIPTLLHLLTISSPPHPSPSLPPFDRQRNTLQHHTERRNEVISISGRNLKSSKSSLDNNRQQYPQYAPSLGTPGVYHQHTNNTHINTAKNNLVGGGGGGGGNAINNASQFSGRKGFGGGGGGGGNASSCASFTKRVSSSDCSSSGDQAENLSFKVKL